MAIFVLRLKLQYEIVEDLIKSVILLSKKLRKLKKAIVFKFGIFLSLKDPKIFFQLLGG
jgi:hypothetical protein